MQKKVAFCGKFLIKSDCSERKLEFFYTKRKWMKGISRTDSERSKGWLVRVYRKGETFSKFFADGKHGGRLKSLTKAKAHLQACNTYFPPPPEPMPRPPFIRTLMKSNKTGVNGISKTYQRSSKKGNLMACYSVFYHLNGQRCNKRFYLHRFADEERAFEAAVAFRKEIEKLMLKEFEARLNAWKAKYCPAPVD
jgi:hypothetical protein